MGFIVRKRVRLGRAFHLNVSRSGLSSSARLGRVTFNSRGTWWARLAPGLFYRSEKGDD